jgi:flagellar biogenesis protein FliO
MGSTTMTAAATQALITSSITEIGGSMLVILGAVLGIGVAYLVFKFGWKKAKGSVR